MCVMTISASYRVTLLLSALLGSSWLVPLASGAISSVHPCSSTVESSDPAQPAHQHGLRVPVSSNATVGSHECSHCSSPQCSMAGHCALTAPAGLASAPAAIEVVSTASLPVPWMRDRPLSANPTPPIPPPQPVL